MSAVVKSINDEVKALKKIGDCYFLTDREMGVVYAREARGYVFVGHEPGTIIFNRYDLLRDMAGIDDDDASNPWDVDMHYIMIVVYRYRNRAEFYCAWRMARMELNRVLFATSGYKDTQNKKWEMMFKSKQWEANVNYTYEIKPNQ